MADAAPRLTALAEQLLGVPAPVRIRAWDGSETGPPGAPVLVVRHRRALRRLLCKPGELGLARAWVAGELDVEGDLYEALDRLAGLLWERGAEAGRHARRSGTRATRRLGPPPAGCSPSPGPGLPPPPPAEEVRRRPARCTPSAATGRPSATTTTSATTSTSWCSARPWSTRAPTGQRPGRDAGGRRSATSSTSSAASSHLQPGQRLLDVGCGWGSMALHAAARVRRPRRRHHALRASRPRTPASASPTRG